MFLYIKSAEYLAEAQELVDFTGMLTLVTQLPENNSIYLCLDHDGLAVIGKDFSPVYIAAIYTKLNTRLQNISSELLIQAIKLKPNKTNSLLERGDALALGCSNPGMIIVWDLTAGLGKDALLIASYGYHVTMVEQNPVLATILYYALQNNFLPNKRLKIVYANSIDFIANSSESPNIVYLDPMFKDNKSAKAKKDMQIIQYLTHNEIEDQSQELFESAYAKVLNKLVIKRDNKQANLVISPKPSYAKLGKTIRYDIYTKIKE